MKWISTKTRIVSATPNLSHLVEPSFQEVNRHVVLAFENDAQRTTNKRYYLPKDYNVTTDKR